jgi:hypothetical protein
MQPQDVDRHGRCWYDTHGTGHRSHQWFERPSAKVSRMSEKTTPSAAFVPPVLQLIVDEARRSRLPEEIDAGRWLVLGRITLGEYITALHNARSRH